MLDCIEIEDVVCEILELFAKKKMRIREAREALRLVAERLEDVMVKFS